MKETRDMQSYIFVVGLVLGQKYGDKQNRANSASEALQPFYTDTLQNIPDLQAPEVINRPHDSEPLNNNHRGSEPFSSNGFQASVGFQNLPYDKGQGNSVPKSSISSGNMFQEVSDFERKEPSYQDSFDRPFQAPRDNSQQDDFKPQPPMGNQGSFNLQPSRPAYNDAPQEPNLYKLGFDIFNKFNPFAAAFSGSDLVESSGGSTPQDASPTKYIPKTSQSEYVSTIPGSEADAYRFVNYAALSYCRPRMIERMVCVPCRYIKNDVEIIKIMSEPYTMGQAVLLVDRRRDQIVLSFRGSVYVENWIQNSKANMVRVSYAKNAKVHQGFKEAIDAIMPLVIEPLKNTLMKYPNHRFILAGHSLGGSMAVLAGCELFKKRIMPWERMELFTYGEPRTGNLAFARWVNSQRTVVTRVVNENDIVPHIVPASLGYVHHSTEVYIHNGRAVNCSTKQVEDIRCSLSRFPSLSVISHNMAWDIALGPLGC